MFKPSKETQIELIYLISAVSIILSLTLPSFKLKVCCGGLTLLALILLRIFFKQCKKIKNMCSEYEVQKNIISDIFKYCPDLIFLKDKNSIYIDCNESFVKINGFYKKEDIIGKSDYELLKPEDARHVVERDKEVFEKKLPVTYLKAIHTQNERINVGEIIKTPLIVNGEVEGILGIVRDVTHREKLIKDIAEKQIQTNTLYDNLPFAALLKDTHGNVLTANKHLLDLLGIKEFPSFPVKLSDIVPEEIFKIAKEEDNIVINTKRVYTNEKEVEFKGKKYWAETLKAPVLNQNNEVINIIVIIKDITIHKEIEKQKETFVETLTHDLKTPTSAQIKALQLLLDEKFGEITPPQKEIMMQILNSCKYMHRMISTILSTYNEEHLKVLSPESFNILELVEECVKEIAFLAEEKKQTIKIHSENKNMVVTADLLELKRVVINLISNAISYSLTGGEINISLKQSKNDFYFEVNSKSGLIAKEDIASLFEKYVTKGTKFRQVGTGLGLYLSKKIIEAHNGKMIANSDNEMGNTFGFEIPFDRNLDLSVQKTSQTFN